MELVSVIVPVYNVEKYLEQCVNSILNQSYKLIEIILVNDGSKDSSGELCEILAKRDDRILVVHKDNEGLGLARNTGLKYVKGKYVTFIDSDDYADPDLIENLYNAIKENNADACIGGYKRVNDDGEVIYKETYEKKIYEKEECARELLPRMLGSSPEKSDSIRMSVWNVLYSMDIIRENNLDFPSERDYISEDIIFDIKYYRYCMRCVVINNSSYTYRVNNTSLTQSYNKDRFKKHKFLYNEIAKMIKRYGLIDECLVRLQRQYFVNVRYCIRQEKKRISGLKMSERIKNITYIISDTQLKNIIRNYPKQHMGIKQKAFLFMVDKNYARVIDILISLGLI